MSKNSVTVVAATTAHLPQIEQLLLHGRHIYVAQPPIDVKQLLRQQQCVVGISSDTLSHTLSSTVWGFASLEWEKRPKSLPLDAPDRLFLAQVGLAKGRSPFADVPTLIDSLLEHLGKRSWTQKLFNKTVNGPAQLIYHGHQHWLVKPLEEAGFTVVERVEFFTLERLQRRIYPQESQPPPYPFRPAQKSELADVARLDAAAFLPLWHIGEAQLRELWTTHRIYVAVDGNQIVGYTAMALLAQNMGLPESGGRNEDPEQAGRHYAHLARIATSPAHRGQGLGRHLLMDCIRYAQQQGAEAVTLNTQTSNDSARELYRSVGFARTGQIYPVLTRTVDK